MGPLEAACGDGSDGLQLPTPDAFSKRQQCLLQLAARVAEPAGLRSLAQVRVATTHKRRSHVVPHPRGRPAVRLHSTPLVIAAALSSANAAHPTVCGTVPI